MTREGRGRKGLGPRGGPVGKAMGKGRREEPTKREECTAQPQVSSHRAMLGSHTITWSFSWHLKGTQGLRAGDMASGADILLPVWY